MKLCMTVLYIFCITYILAYIQHNWDVSLGKSIQMVLILRGLQCVGVCNFNFLIYEELRDFLCMELLLVKSVFLRQIIY